MIKKVVLLVFVLGLVGGGFFYWWNSQADVRELNEGFSGTTKIIKDWRGDYFFIQEINGKLEKIIKVTKHDGQYKIFNNKYSYEFLLPSDRTGIWRLEYLEKNGESEMEYVCRVCEKGSILYVGLVGGKGDNVILESYKLKDPNITVDDFSKIGNPAWLYKMEVERTTIGNIDVVIASREYGEYVKENERERFYNYFFRGETNFYKLEHVSREFLDFLILNGKW